MGILANSATVSHTTSTDDDTNAGYLTGERITLSTVTGSTFAWSLAAPTTSASGRAALSETDDPTPTFIPDVAGYYTLVCVLDSTVTFVQRLSVSLPAESTALEAIRLQPLTDAQVATPALGVALYYSSDQSALCMKFPGGYIHTVDTTTV